MAAASFGELFSGSLSYYKQHAKILLIGALVFGALFGGAQMYMAQQMQKQIMGSLQGLGGDPEKMQELSNRLQAGDEAAMEEFYKEMESISGNLEGMSDADKFAIAQETAAGAFLDMLPTMALLILIFAVISFVGMAYYLVQSVSHTDNPGELFGEALKKALPLIGVSLWTGIRSFAWIPFIGPILGLIFMPRFMLAGVILIKEQKGVFESTKLSYQRSQGYWGKIVGNVILLAICMIVVLWALSLAVAPLLVVSVAAASVAASIVQQVVSAFAIIFWTNLSITVMANPRGAVSAPAAAPAQAAPPPAPAEPAPAPEQAPAEQPPEQQ